MRLWHLLVRQVLKSDNPDNSGSDNSARTKHPMVVIWLKKCYAITIILQATYKYPLRKGWITHGKKTKYNFPHDRSAAF